MRSRSAHAAVLNGGARVARWRVELTMRRAAREERGCLLAALSASGDIQHSLCHCTACAIGIVGQYCEGGEK